MDTLVFYEGKLLKRIPPKDANYPLWMVCDMQEGCYVCVPAGKQGLRWYREDHTPVLIEDVPKELQALALLLS